MNRKANSCPVAPSAHDRGPSVPQRPKRGATGPGARASKGSARRVRAEKTQSSPEKLPWRLHKPAEPHADENKPHGKVLDTGAHFCARA